MSNVILTLGGVPFQDMEVPEKISFGGKQRVAVQNLIGGGRVVAALGLDDGEISFSGIFSGSDAVSRAQLLDAARALGAALPLVWDGFFYTVIIEGFTAEYRKANLIPFSITCVVVSDPLASLAALAAPVANLVGNDLSAAEALSGQAGISLSGLSATSLAGFSTVQGLLGAAVGTSGVGLLSGTATLNGASDAQTGVAAINTLTGNSGQLAALTNMSGYVNRAATNLASEVF
jgi:uncharacterized protein YciI